MPDLRALLFETALLVLCAALLGLVVNHRLVFDAFSGRMTLSGQAGDRPAQSLVSYPVPIQLDEVRELAGQGAVLVDARSQDIFALGHIPGALPLPLLELDSVLPGFGNQVPRERTVVTYCSGYGCQDSFDLAMRLAGEGYRDVHLYEGGFSEWQAAGLPVTEGLP
jgi:rhodanese-related sulfurtransferase